VVYSLNIVKVLAYIYALENIVMVYLIVIFIIVCGGAIGILFILIIVIKPVKILLIEIDGAYMVN